MVNTTAKKATFFLRNTSPLKKRLVLEKRLMRQEWQVQRMQSITLQQVFHPNQTTSLFVLLTVTDDD